MALRSDAFDELVDFRSPAENEEGALDAFFEQRGRSVLRRRVIRACSVSRDRRGSAETW